MKSTLENRDHFKDSKWSRHKIETFRGVREFFGPLNGASDSEGRDIVNFKHHFWRGNCKINPVL